MLHLSLSFALIAFYLILLPGWRNVVRVAVVDCVVEANTPLCREYEIMYYPTVKFFPAHSKDFLGKAIEKGESAQSLRKSLAEILVKEQQEGRGTDWPNLTPYRSGNLHNLWKDVPNTTKYAALVFTDKESDIGVELILELSLIPAIQARVVLSDNEVLAKAMHVLTYPSVVLVDSDETSEQVQTTDKSYKGLLIAIHSTLKQKGIDLPPNEEEPLVIEPKVETSTEHPYVKQARDIMKEGDVAFLADLERALRYSLTHEIASYSTIMSQAVYDYVTAIHNYFPLSPDGKLFFEFLLSDLKKDPVLTGKEWKEKISQAELKVPGPVWGKWALENNGWLGCQGSQIKYRGYPCALWTTFHTLTVNAMDNACKKQEPASLLRAIHGYIINFFGCSDCAEHFNQMAQEANLFSEIKQCEQAAEWLWDAHNKVNKRLQNDSSSDPVYPKVIFPTQERCGDCYNNSKWVMPNVFKYLSHVYGMKYINQLGTKHNIVDSISPTAEAYHFVSSGWIMSPIDVSLCVVLYITSGIIIMFVWFKFLIRRSYRKKAYAHDLLGKV